MKSRTISSPLGPIRLSAEAGELRELRLTSDAESVTEPKAAGADEPVLIEAERQLGEYFAGLRRDFDLPLRPAGTPFQRETWESLRRIPYGTTSSYAGLASSIGRPKAVRAVGAANARNPLAIVIPCHRVIGSDGSLTGYAGGLEVKRWLLAHESSFAS